MTHSGLLGEFFFPFFLLIALVLFPNYPAVFPVFLSVISKRLYWHRLLPASKGEKKSIQKPLHASICQIFASTSSPAGLAAKIIPVMAAAAAATTPDAVARAVWRD